MNLLYCIIDHNLTSNTSHYTAYTTYFFSNIFSQENFLYLTLSEKFSMEANVTKVKVDDSRATETRTVASNDSASAQTTGKNDYIIIVNIIFQTEFFLNRSKK